MFDKVRERLNKNKAKEAKHHNFSQSIEVACIRDDDPFVYVVKKVLGMGVFEEYRYDEDFYSSHSNRRSSAYAPSTVYNSSKFKSIRMHKQKQSREKSDNSNSHGSSQIRASAADIQIGFLGEKK